MPRLVLATPPSDGARQLRERTGILRVSPDRAYRVRASTVVNWGNTALVTRSNQTVFNSPHCVSVAVNKLSALTAMQSAGVETLAFDTDYPRLRALYPKKRILARRFLSASEGRGIEIIEPGSIAPPAPLYTVYFPKEMELRVHVWGTEAIVVQKKIRSAEAAADPARTTFQRVVRNHANGWRFTSNVLLEGFLTKERLERVKDQAVQAVINIGLDFGAVDMLLSEDRTVVCEVNTRPGIGSSPVLDAYARKLEEVRDNGR